MNPNLYGLQVVDGFSLLPCPFCGGSAEIIYTVRHAFCMACGINGSYSTYAIFYCTGIFISADIAVFVEALDESYDASSNGNGNAWSAALL